MKTALFVFNGEPMCFIHVLLNALDLHDHGHETCIVMEGASVALAPALAKAGHPLAPLLPRCGKRVCSRARARPAPSSWAWPPRSTPQASRSSATCPGIRPCVRIWTRDGRSSRFDPDARGESQNLPEAR